jgi:hypothetical protein
MWKLLHENCDFRKLSPVLKCAQTCVSYSPFNPCQMPMSSHSVLHQLTQICTFLFLLYHAFCVLAVAAGSFSSFCALLQPHNSSPNTPIWSILLNTEPTKFRGNACLISQLISIDYKSNTSKGLEIFETRQVTLVSASIPLTYIL